MGTLLLHTSPAAVEKKGSKLIFSEVEVKKIPKVWKIILSASPLTSFLRLERSNTSTLQLHLLKSKEK